MSAIQANERKFMLDKSKEVLDIIENWRYVFMKSKDVTQFVEAGAYLNTMYNYIHTKMASDSEELMLMIEKMQKQPEGGKH